LWLRLRLPLPLLVLLLSLAADPAPHRRQRLQARVFLVHTRAPSSSVYHRTAWSTTTTTVWGFTAILTGTGFLVVAPIMGVVLIIMVAAPMLGLTTTTMATPLAPTVPRAAPTSSSRQRSDSSSLFTQAC
jgi:hypothetical protein